MRLSDHKNRFRTERYRIRRGFGNKPILQVWVEYPNTPMSEWIDINDYRDAPTLLEETTK